MEKELAGVVGLRTRATEKEKYLPPAAWGEWGHLDQEHNKGVIG